jgi:hypothetical protein
MLSAGRFLRSAAGWGLAWAFGLSVVFYIHPTLGWPFVGIIGGFAVARTLRSAGVLPRRADRTVVVMIWLTGAIISAETAGYGILRGWLIAAAFGGLATGFFVFGKRAPPRAIAMAVGWSLGGALGSAFVARAGPILAPLFASTIGGFFAWLLCWGIGGIITGVVAQPFLAMVGLRRSSPNLG